MLARPSVIRDARTTESLIRDLERMRCIPCTGCAKPLCLHQVLMSIAMGFKDAPRCLPCLGEALDRDPAQLRDSLFDHVSQRQCYAGAWNWANRAVGLPEGSMPPTLQDLAPTRQRIGLFPTERGMDAGTGSWRYADGTWDAGDQGCGELVLELRLRIEAMLPNQCLKLCARDPGALEDLPAWCRLTGHCLVLAEHPNYWIKRKD